MTGHQDERVGTGDLTLGLSAVTAFLCFLIA